MLVVAANRMANKRVKRFLDGQECGDYILRARSKKARINAGL